MHLKQWMETPWPNHMIAFDYLPKEIRDIMNYSENPPHVLDVYLAVEKYNYDAKRIAQHFGGFKENIEERSY